MDRPLITRREFLRLSGVGLASIFAHNLPDLLPPTPQLEYDGESKKIIDDVKKRFGVQIISPQIMDTRFVTPPTPNKTWEKLELLTIKNAIENLPPKFHTSSRFPTEIRLYRGNFGDTNNGFKFSGYGNRTIEWWANLEGFDHKTPCEGIEARYFGARNIYLAYATAHEVAHSFTEAEPEVLDSWNRQMGWEKTSYGWDSGWRNINQSANTVAMHGSDRSPIEDFAVSVGLMSYNPAFLTPNRLRFFMENRSFADWRVVHEYRDRES